MDFKEKAALIEQKVAEAATKSEVEALRADAVKKDEAIANLDKSVKDMAESIKSIKTKSAAKMSTLRESFYSHKEDICKFVAEKRDRFEVEVKQINTISTALVNPNLSLSVQGDTHVYELINGENAFLLAIGVKARTGNKLSWVESTTQNGVGYLTEGAANTNASDVAFAEKQRAFAKVGTKYTITTEMSDWFDALYQFVETEALRLVDNFIDAEAIAGAGDDTNYPNKVYGVIGQSTAFAALAAGAVESATIADVILDSAQQVRKNGFTPNACFLSWASYAALCEVKNENGDYILDKVNNMLMGIKVYPSSHVVDVAASEGVSASQKLLVLDTRCVQIYAGNSMQVEFIRNGSIDGWDVYIRKAAQVKVPTAHKKGIIYTAHIPTAIAALQSA